MGRHILAHRKQVPRANAEEESSNHFMEVMIPKHFLILVPWHTNIHILLVYSMHSIFPTCGPNLKTVTSNNLCKVYMGHLGMLIPGHHSFSEKPEL